MLTLLDSCELLTLLLFLDMTAKYNKVPAWLSDNEKATDMQVVLRLLMLMEGQGETEGDPFRVGLKRMYVEIAEDALKSMTNPMAKAMLTKEIEV